MFTVLDIVRNCKTMELQYCNIIILWDHHRICGPSLTETSLCGQWPYKKKVRMPICELVNHVKRQL